MYSDYIKLNQNWLGAFSANVKHKSIFLKTRKTAISTPVAH